MRSPGQSADRSDGGEPEVPELVREWAITRTTDKTMANMALRSPVLLLLVMVLLGLAGLVAFVACVGKFADTGDGGALGAGIFLVVLFGAVSFLGIRIALPRLRAKRAYDAYYRQHPQP